MVKSVSLATVANAGGRMANVVVPLTVIGVCGVDGHTDLFFAILAVGFYFYGMLANAIAQSTTALLINGGLVIGRKSVGMTAGLGGVLAFLIVGAINGVFFSRTNHLPAGRCLYGGSRFGQRSRFRALACL